MSSIRRAALVVALTAALAGGLAGCKKEEAPAPKAAAPAPVVEAPKPAVPAQPPEERAAVECAAPLEEGKAEELTLGGLTATRAGSKLTVTSKDADGKVILGVLGPLNEDSGENLVTLKKYLKFFTDEKADAIVVSGDVGETAEGIARVLTAATEAKLPVLVIAGNRECRADYVEGVEKAKATANGQLIIDMNRVRVVELSEATLVSLPGYHDPKFFGCAEGCQFFASTANEVVQAAKSAKSPVVLVAHAHPKGEGQMSIDYATGGGNVGSEQVSKAIADGAIKFGLFSNIKEAGGRATDAAGTTLISEGTTAKELFLNPGPADTVGWAMNDGTKSSGMAAVLTLDDATGSFKLFRAKALTAAEKAEAKKLVAAP